MCRPTGCYRRACFEGYNCSPGAILASGVDYAMLEYPVKDGSYPHDVAPAPDGTVWYTAQNTDALGSLDPMNGETHHIPPGSGSSPHGVIVCPDGAAWRGSER